MKKRIFAYTLATVISVAPAVIATSCGESAAEAADREREELKQRENEIEAQRKTRERENAVELNRISSKKR